MGVDRLAQQRETGVEVLLPQRVLPVGQRVAAPDAVHEHVEPAVLGLDPLDQRADLLRVAVIDAHSDRAGTLAARPGGEIAPWAIPQRPGLLGQRRRFVDRLRAVHR